VEILLYNTSTKRRSIWSFDKISKSGDGGGSGGGLANLDNLTIIWLRLTKKFYTQNAQYYSTNTDRYISLLKKLDEGIMQAVQTVPLQNRKLLTYHDSWAYFASRYNMTLIGVIQPSDFGEPTPQEVARIIDQIRIEKYLQYLLQKYFPHELLIK
jgi:ABC-type Zn uptake system ZnuABC Zn-binding protein ZnuA